MAPFGPADEVIVYVAGAGAAAVVTLNVSLTPPMVSVVLVVVE